MDPQPKQHPSSLHRVISLLSSGTTKHSDDHTLEVRLNGFDSDVTRLRFYPLPARDESLIPDSKPSLSEFIFCPNGKMHNPTNSETLCPDPAAHVAQFGGLTRKRDLRLAINHPTVHSLLGHLAHHGYDIDVTKRLEKGDPRRAPPAIWPLVTSFFLRLHPPT